MSRSERLLKVLLRAEAFVLLCALPAVVMPTEWMDAIHQRLGMGELPRSPLVEYLTRSLSLLYAAFAPLLLVMASDLRRYLPMIWVLSWVRLAFGTTLLLLDLRMRLPTIWVASEGPMVIVLSSVGLWLVVQVRQQFSRESG